MTVAIFPGIKICILALMQIRENISLQPYNTFGIAAQARYFAAFQSIDELKELLNSKFQISNSLIDIYFLTHAEYDKDKGKNDPYF